MQETRCQAKAGPMGLVKRKQPPSDSDHLFRTCPTGGTTGVQLPGVLIPHTGRGNTDKGVGSPHTTQGLPIAEEPILNGSCGDFQFAFLPWVRHGEDPVPRQNLGGDAELSYDSLPGEAGTRAGAGHMAAPAGPPVHLPSGGSSRGFDMTQVMGAPRFACMA